MRRVGLLLALWAGGCAATYPPADRLGGPGHPQPTSADIAALLADRVPVLAPEAPFSIRLYPAVVLPGGSTWLTCHVPPSVPPHWRLRITFEAKFSSERSAEDTASRLITDIPCGTWLATCALSPDGARWAIREQPLTVPGPDCEGAA